MSSFLMENGFKRLSIFINNKGSLNSLKIFAFCTVFLFASPDIRTGGAERILMLFRKLFKTDQQTFGSVRLSLRTLLFLNITHFCISYKVSTPCKYSA